jgi:hypothetical protein
MSQRDSAKAPRMGLDSNAEPVQSWDVKSIPEVDHKKGRHNRIE